MKQRDVKEKSWQGKKVGADSFRLLAFSSIIFNLLFSCSGKSAKHDFISTITEQASDTTIVFIDTIYKSALELSLDSLGLVDIQEHISTIVVDLKYASPDNFTGDILYKDLTRAYLHPYALKKLVKAQSLLKNNYPGYSLLIYDAARPLSVQQEMYNIVKDTKYRAYVANPERTSLHNYGMAVDLTICDEDDIPLDMGTAFDYFGAKAGINNEESFVATGALTRQQVNNRKLLRSVMQNAGFVPIRGEWWHFNACSLNEAKKIGTLLH